MSGRPACSLCSCPPDVPELVAGERGRFCTFVADHVAAWKVKYWTATMETDKSGSLHMHIMVQFTQSRDCSTASFAFDGRRPNVSSHDYLGEGACKTRSRLLGKPVVLALSVSAV